MISVHISVNEQSSSLRSPPRTAQISFTLLFLLGGACSYSTNSAGEPEGEAWPKGGFLTLSLFFRIFGLTNKETIATV
jgi:hypothetical protein